MKVESVLAVPSPGCLLFVAALLAVNAMCSHAQALDLTEGIAVCDNVVSTGTAAPSRYFPSQRRLELPLVFAPGFGWYRVVAQQAPGTEYEFEIKELAPTCLRQPSPAAYLPKAQTLFAPAVELTDDLGAVTRFDLQMVLQTSTGRWVPSQIDTGGTATAVFIAPATPVTSAAAGTSATPISPARSNVQTDNRSRVFDRRQAAAATVEAVQLDRAVGLYPAGFIVPLTRILGAHVSGAEAGCNGRHLHGGPSFFDTVGPYADPNPNGCGYGTIVVVPAESIDPGVINASVPVGTDYCGSDITAVFFARLKVMAARLAALPDTERGVFDGTMFLARNGTNMDFVAGTIKDPANNPICPTAKCTGVQHTSTFTLCGQCMISHIDNDIEFGFVARMLGVPWAVQAAGGHTWDLVQRQALDPLASQISYMVGNELADRLLATPNATDAQMCSALTNTRILGHQGMMSLARVHSPATVYADEMKQFGKDTCMPCPHGCPEATVLKDFSTQTWSLDGGGSAPPM